MGGWLIINLLRAALLISLVPKIVGEEDESEDGKVGGIWAVLDFLFVSSESKEIYSDMQLMISILDEEVAH